MAIQLQAHDLPEDLIPLLAHLMIDTEKVTAMVQENKEPLHVEHVTIVKNIYGFLKAWIKHDIEQSSALSRDELVAKWGEENVYAVLPINRNILKGYDTDTKKSLEEYGDKDIYSGPVNPTLPQNQNLVLGGASSNTRRVLLSYIDEPDTAGNTLPMAVALETANRFHTKSMYGEYDHPRMAGDDDLKDFARRVLSINIGNTCVNFDSPMVTDLPDGRTALFANAHIVGTRAADILTAIDEQPEARAFGLRGYADAKKNIKLVVTWDYVGPNRLKVNNGCVLNMSGIVVATDATKS